jgi:hypothetical protein
MNIRTTLAASMVYAVLVAPVHTAWAADTAAAPASIAAALQVQAGKRVKLHLASGESLEGKVQSQNDQVVVIAELTGMEYFSATVRLDQVTAVVARSAPAQ